MKPEEVETQLTKILRDPRIADVALLPAFDEPLRRMFALPQQREGEIEGSWTVAR